MKLTVTSNVSDKDTILYLLELDVDGQRVQKIGITSRKIEDRCLEIIESYFKGRREFCWLRPKRFRKVDDAYVKEQWILRYLKEYSCIIEKKFSGSTELVQMDLDVLVNLYEKVITGEEMIVAQWEACPVCGKDKKFSMEIDGKEKKVCGHMCEDKKSEDSSRRNSGSSS